MPILCRGHSRQKVQTMEMAVLEELLESKWFVQPKIYKHKLSFRVCTSETCQFVNHHSYNSYKQNTSFSNLANVLLIFFPTAPLLNTNLDILFFSI